ncbi:MAG TPA: hypothetical protein VK027_02165 [Chitinophagaceae bacterium]|nr:hypothetical protein [Chitinophagaceae bacterium]
MKAIKFLGVISAIAMASLFTSCKKDYTCTCKINDTVLKTQTLTKMSKKKATEKCKDMEVHTNEHCSI